MEPTTQNIIKQIAEIQIDALNKLKTRQIFRYSEAELCKLLQTTTDEIQNAIDHHIQVYKDILENPDCIRFLTEYQTCLCSYILWRMEENWISDNQEGVLGAWVILSEAERKFHQEYRIIL